MTLEEELVNATPLHELEELVRLNEGTEAERVFRSVVEQRLARRDTLALEEFEKLAALGSGFATDMDALEFAREIGFPLVAARDDEPGVGYEWARDVVDREGRS